MKKYILVFVGLLFLTLQCKEQEKSYTFKRAKLNSGTKELLNKFMEYCNMSKKENKISIHEYSNNEKSYYIVNSGELTNFVIDYATSQKDYAYFYNGFYVFITPDLEGQLFSKDGILEIPQNKVKMIDGETHIPLTEDVISWEFEIINGKLSNFSYLFCTLTEAQIQEIESIKF